MTSSLGAIITIIVILIINIVGTVLLFTEYDAKKQCEQSESKFCPSYACDNVVTSNPTACGIVPYRFDSGGNIECQKYLTTKEASKYKSS